jgi:hypothetical protein
VKKGGASRPFVWTVDFCPVPANYFPNWIDVVYRRSFVVPSSNQLRENGLRIPNIRSPTIAIEVEPIPKSVSEMFGEICRELAVLVLVFVPLELYKSSGVSGFVIVAAIAGSIMLAAIGILIEWLRKSW